MLDDTVFYGVLNYNRPPPYDLLKSFPNPSNVLLCASPITSAPPPDSPTIQHRIPANSSVAVCKNKIIDYARKLGARYVFIVEDDVVILNKTVFMEYLTLAKRLQYPILMNGYISSRNRVMQNKLNPALKIKADQYKFIANRNCDCGFTLLHLTNDAAMFDESLTQLEQEWLISTLYKKGQIPSNGFFPDIWDSHTYMKRADVPRVRSRLHQDYVNDLKSIGGPIQIDQNVDYFLRYCQGVVSATHE